jgi:hypothetical protein
MNAAINILSSIDAAIALKAEWNRTLIAAEAA